MAKKKKAASAKDTGEMTLADFGLTDDQYPLSDWRAQAAEPHVEQMAHENTKEAKLMKAIKKSDEELFKLLGVRKRNRVPGFAQLLREAAHEPPREADPFTTGTVISPRAYPEYTKVSASEPGPRFRTPVSPERVGPPAPYEYIGDELEQRMPPRRAETGALTQYPSMYYTRPFGAGGPNDYWGAQELQLRAHGHTPETPPPPDPTGGRPLPPHLSDVKKERPTDTLIADPRHEREADYALWLLKQAGLRDR